MSIPQMCLSMKESPASALHDDPELLKAMKFAGLINSNQIESDEKLTRKRAFSEDFILEHSVSGQQVTSSEFAGYF